MLISKELDDAYYKLNAKIESNNNPKAQAPTSSASGLHQFIRSTWEELGFDWKDVFDPAVQRQAIVKFTEQNAARLRKAGCAINFATLYGSHFLGVAGFLKIMRALPSDPISSVTTLAQRKANRTILTGSVKDFCDWLERKTGDKVTKRYDMPETTVPPYPIPTSTLPEGKKSKLPVLLGAVFTVAIIVYFVFIKR